MALSAWHGRSTRTSITTLITTLVVSVGVTPAVSAQSSSDTLTATASRQHTAADIAFMQGMIGHHAQALEMVALVASRSTRLEMESLAERIAVSQRDEISIMQRWLTARGEATSMPHDMHSSHASMPGMLSPAQMDSLRTADGTAFDKLFLQYMIQHHEGALVMVAELLRSPGAAQEPMVFQIMSDVDADQRAEIRRMKMLLAQW
ncbi:MAG TPA: DUF305 domain-containing protein [Gemmatimonas aurantiaca]|uniref:DUF305 domain-containing protein n=2 Tax=Gemmatimonas aurantiaca TaxID=173480 RepID=C1ABS5_GEMAT|nr:DUF305 domain-containing protein [Gemmatimonas aurantiaca]BAH39952.1 hypothetical protein GAU_2910 [Gemmatimonas aurantiaca T-27]HCT58039.1 DUF305 domain-containing protein [Gemmatimonas aurantiaca]